MRVAVAVLLAAALAAQEPDAILARLSAETTNVLVVRDPLPVIQRALASPVVAQLFAATAELQQESFGRAFDPAVLRKQLATIAPYVPVEIVIAAPTRTLDRLSRAASLFACYAAASVLVGAGQADGAAVAELRAAANEDLALLDELPLQAWVRTRDERTAESWFDAIVEQLRERAKELGLAVEVGADRIDVRATPFAAGAPLRAKLAAVGIGVAKAPASELHFAIEQVGTLLSLRVGKLSPGPCPAARFGERWRDSGSLLFGRTEAGEQRAWFVAAYNGIVALANSSPEADQTQSMSRLLGFLDRVKALLATQTVSLALDRGFAWRHEIEERSGALDETHVVPASLLRLASPDDGPMLAAGDSLDACLASILETVLTMDLDDANGPAKAVIELLNDPPAKPFAGGTLLVARPAAMRRMKGVTGPLPFAAVALAARVKSAADGEAFMRELTKRIAAAAGGESDLWREQDLGLGAKTHALRLDHVAPQLAAREVDWDLAPHWLVTDELLLVSTDPSLTRSLLAKAREVAGVPAPTRRDLHWLRVPGPAIVDTMAAMAKWTPVVAELQERPLDRSAALFAALHAAGEQIEWFELRSEIEGSVRRQVLELRLRDGK